MKIIGSRKERGISFHASAELLKQGARFNDEMHNSPTGKITCVPKGLYRFKTHDAANQHILKCIIAAMADVAEQKVPAFERARIASE